VSERARHAALPWVPAARALGAAGVGCLLTVLLWPAGADPLGDPTRPPPDFRRPAAAPASPAAPEGGWRLDAVLIGPDRDLALLNGRLVRPGERIAGALVLAVGPRGVRLRVGGREVRVALPSALDKRRTAPREPGARQ
jgi:hypothetical protein